MDKEEIGEILHKRFLEVRETEPSGSLCFQDPEKWFYIATQLLSGKSRSYLLKKEGIDFYASSRVERALTGDLNKIKQYQAMKSAERLSNLGEIQDMAIQKWADNIDKMDITAKDIKEIAAAKSLENTTMLRLAGEANIVVETRKAVTMEEVRNLIDSLPEADVIDVTDELD